MKAIPKIANDGCPMRHKGIHNDSQFSCMVTDPETGETYQINASPFQGTTYPNVARRRPRVDTAKVIQMYNSGEKIMHIMSHCKCSQTTLYEIVSRHKLTRRQ